MTGFFIKKAFFDGWDNLISLVALNLGYLLVLLAAYGALEVLAISAPLGIILLIVTSLLNSLYTAMVSVHTKGFAWYTRPGFSGFKSGFSTIWRHALLHFGINTLLLTVAIFIIPFYLSYSSLFAFAVAVVMFWIALAFMLAMMYFFPLAAQLPEDKPLKTLKKALMIVGDNIWFSLFLGIYSLITFALSIVFATIMPGVGGIELSHQVAMKLLMYKYDHLEAHPEDRKNVPWEELLFDEREKVGTRTFRGMIFPWKE
jgi:hypothetical protein